MDQRAAHIVLRRVFHAIATTSQMKILLAYSNCSELLV
jgi:hypothetical protein